MAKPKKLEDIPEEGIDYNHALVSLAVSAKRIADALVSINVILTKIWNDMPGEQ